jgi:hypothetical protein
MVTFMGSRVLTAVKMEAVSFCEVLVNFCRTNWWVSHLRRYYVLLIVTAAMTTYSLTISSLLLSTYVTQVLFTYIYLLNYNAFISSKLHHSQATNINRRIL